MITFYQVFVRNLLIFGHLWLKLLLVALTIFLKGNLALNRCCKRFISIRVLGCFYSFRLHIVVYNPLVQTNNNILVSSQKCKELSLIFKQHTMTTYYTRYLTRKLVFHIPYHIRYTYKKFNITDFLQRILKVNQKNEQQTKTSSALICQITRCYSVAYKDRGLDLIRLSIPNLFIHIVICSLALCHVFYC